MPFYEILSIALMGTFILALFLGYPVAWLLAGVSMLFAAIAITLTTQFGIDTFLLTSWVKFSGIIDRFDAIMSNWVLVSLPMFVYMGLMLDRSGVADVMMRNFVKVFGGIRGGLGLTVIVIGILLAASTGIVGASVVLLAMLSMPIMLQHHYSKPLACGIVAASGTLGILIPPSIMLVLMADQVSVSVGDLFMGALVPGLLLGVLYMIFVMLVGIFRPDIVPPRPADAEKLTVRQIGMAFLSTIPTFGLILVVLGSIFFGIATPTEASGLGAFGAMVLAAANGKLNWKVIRQVGLDTTTTTCFIFAIFIGATVFAYVLRMIGGDELITEMFKGTGLGPNGLVMLVLAVVFVAGFFLDWFEIVLIILPLLAPVIKHAGLDMTWFLILVALMLQTSFLTPPVGFSLFYLKGVVPKGVTIRDIYIGVIPFVALQMMMVAICFQWPQVILWLPEQMYGAK
ncbi:MAG: TRAP transporter large permease subunit [Rhodoferax sp.]|uniref:TRAP transporter large permease n=1 Tax=Rhodoferax sp. TaxID=50421 RepID=UPI0008BA1E27|nr:TRAP transporter large permease subunit [Rhodoferax sp.]MDP2680179.1 TRAP transporter large permease subunit [Rhodoferax sp.]OGB51371.1 MAG: C4-dicarboxylate ABC transporter [Burkholderiales bacterium RIFOXYD12_FULL_59_19]OGB81614.1 MAG: C4-dicarboxylate ABC transporter [Burkholderiales bacterium RIFOXYD2_FULL_59_8]